MTKIKQIVVSGLFAAVLFFSGAGLAAASDAELLVQIQAVKRQILLLQIQLVQMRIADLQRQLDQINAAAANAYIDVIYPNGGEKIENRKCYYIRWESKSVDKVAIGLVTPEIETFVANSVPASDGRYYWCTGDIAGSEYRIRIFDTAKPSVGDVSNGKFMVFDNTGGNHCSDGTTMGKCSMEKPKLCVDDELDLVDACHSCGCPSGYSCGSDSMCH